MSNVRTRFAPSPTGYLHVGGARTALFNWAFARKMGGQFVLRIEDTDTKRSTPEAVAAIFEGMNWLGLNWDEGPGHEKEGVKYFQTERLDLYDQYAQQLLTQGDAYKCYRTTEELAKLREETKATGYRREWMGTEEERAQWDAEGRPFVIRFKSPAAGEIVIDDIVHGEVKFNIADMVDDFVMIKNDGIPTYNYAVVIDDATMEITHVLRGDDHLSNTPKQVAIYQALGLKLPIFGHMPMILGADKQKLSKRHGATSVTMYRDMGYLPEALLNQLARLGWSSGDKEIISMKELIELFNLEGLNKSAATFDFKKLDYLNSHYIREAPMSILLPGEPQSVWAEQVLEQLRPRVKNLNDLRTMYQLFKPGPVGINEEARAKHLTPDNCELIRLFVREISDIEGEDWTVTSLNAYITDFVEAKSIKIGTLAQAIRVAITGSTSSPGLAETMSLMGKEVVLSRLNSVNKVIANLI